MGRLASGKLSGRLGFYVAERILTIKMQDLYQDIMAKIVQALRDLRNPSAKPDVLLLNYCSL